MGVAYITSMPGLIKVAEEVFNFIGFMCIACHSWMTSRGDAFLAASIGAFIITGLLLIVFVLDLQSRVALPWSKVQFFYCLVWALFYLITASLVIELGRWWSDSYVAGGVFGLFATITYLIDAYFHYKHEEEP